MNGKSNDCCCGFPSGENTGNCERCQFVARIDELENKIAVMRSAIEQIVCTHEDDRGVILLSSESPCSFDAMRNGWVYEHEHFSELGEAMVSLWKMTNPEA